MTTLWISLGAIFLLWDVPFYFLGVKPMLPWELKQAIRQEGEDIVLLDVRSKAEYDWFHIEGARHVPDLGDRLAGIARENAGKRVVVICMTSHRSPPAAYRLKKEGNLEVYNLTWGMLGFKLFGGKTFPPAGGRRAAAASISWTRSMSLASRSTRLPTGRENAFTSPAIRLPDSRYPWR